MDFTHLIDFYLSVPFRNSFRDWIQCPLWDCREKKWITTVSQGELPQDRICFAWTYPDLVAEPRMHTTVTWTFHALSAGCRESFGRHRSCFKFIHRSCFMSFSGSLKAVLQIKFVNSCCSCLDCTRASLTCKGISNSSHTVPQETFLSQAQHDSEVKDLWQWKDLLDSPPLSFSNAQTCTQLFTVWKTVHTTIWPNSKVG